MNKNKLADSLELWFDTVKRDSNLFLRDPVAKLMRRRLTEWDNWKNKTRGYTKELLDINLKTQILDKEENDFSLKTQYWEYPDLPSYEDMRKLNKGNLYFGGISYSDMIMSQYGYALDCVYMWMDKADLYCPPNERGGHFKATLELCKSVEDMEKSFRKDYLKLVDFLNPLILEDLQWREVYFEWEKRGGIFPFEDRPRPYVNPDNPLSFIQLDS